MMMILGLFVFRLQTLPYQTMQRNVDYRWAANGRVGRRSSMQFLGLGEETITLSGVLLPEITGGKMSLFALELMADEGRAWPLIEGSGSIYGMFIVEKVSTTKTLFFKNGTPRRIEFSLTLKRTDEGLLSMLGDLFGQAKSLIGGLFS